MRLTEQLMTVAKAYCAAKELSLARVSTLVFNDGKKLTEIGTGVGDLSTKRFESAMTWFAANWPKRLGWPRGIKRPEVVLRAAE